MSAVSSVPFSPVPASQVEIPFRGHGDEGPWSTLTYSACPLRVLWEDNYRLAALEIAYRGGDLEKARQFAQTGVAMEDAYIERIRTQAQVAA